MTFASPASSIDGGFYTWVTELAQRSPAALDSVVRLWSDYGLALFALLMLASWWRSRPSDPARTAMALCTPWPWWPRISSTTWSSRPSMNSGPAGHCMS